MLVEATEFEVRVAELKKRILEGKERCIASGEKIFGPEYSEKYQLEPIQ